MWMLLFRWNFLSCSLGNKCLSLWLLPMAYVLIAGLCPIRYVLLIAWVPLLRYFYIAFERCDLFTYVSIMVGVTWTRFASRFDNDFWVRDGDEACSHKATLQSLVRFFLSWILLMIYSFHFSILIKSLWRNLPLEVCFILRYQWIDRGLGTDAV